MTASAKITVLGAGSYGTALAICLARNGHKTLLWGRDANQVNDMISARENTKYLADCPFPDSLEPTTDLAAAVTASDNILVVVPSHAFGNMLKDIQPMLNPEAKVAWATKGLDPQSGDLLQNVAKRILGDKVALAVLSGPLLLKKWP